MASHRNFTFQKCFDIIYRYRIIPKDLPDQPLFFKVIHL